MPQYKSSLDTSLARNIEQPSQAFRDFLRQYFSSEMIWTRREEDRALPGTLTGREREIAEQMILANLKAGPSHLIDAAARLGLTQALPVLRTLLDTGCADRVQTELALYRLNGMSREEFFERCARHLAEGGEWAVWHIMIFTNQVFPADQSRSLINLALRNNDYSARADGYKAAVEWHYIAAHGGTYTERLASQVRVYEMAAAYVQTEQPDYYTGLQYYVGDATAANKSLFEQRLAELWVSDRASRTMPFFTEINYRFTRELYPSYFDDI